MYWKRAQRQVIYLSQVLPFITPQKIDCPKTTLGVLVHVTQYLRCNGDDYVTEMKLA